MRLVVTADHVIVDRGQSVTCCGPTRMTVVAGAFHHAALATPLVKTSRRRLITATD